MTTRRIQILITFRDGYDTYHAGDARTVSDADAERFIAAGWAADGNPAPEVATPASVDLAVADLTHATGVDHHG